LLEEAGEFVWDPNQSVVRPELSFTTTGNRDFDVDCDGTSNLAELYRDTDPLQANGSDTACEPFVPPADIDPNGSSFPIVLVAATDFIDTGFTQR